MLGVLLAAVLGPAIAWAVDITACGQSVQPGEVGELRADLVCPPVSVGVHLVGGATVALNGFALVGQGTGAGVQCQGTLSHGAWCTVEGPGEIRSFENAVAGGGGRLRLRNVALRFNRHGVLYKAPRVIELLHVVATDNDIGISARGGRVRGHDVVTSRNRQAGVWTNSITKFVRLTATGNGAFGGVFTAPFRRSDVTRLIDSTITGNDGLGQGYDVLSTGRLRLINTTCGRGARIRWRRSHQINVRAHVRCAQ